MSDRPSAWVPTPVADTLQRVPWWVRDGVVYPAGLVVAATAAGVAAGLSPSLPPFVLTLVAAGLGLLGLHDPDGPPGRARVRDAGGNVVDEAERDPGGDEGAADERAVADAASGGRVGTAGGSGRGAGGRPGGGGAPGAAADGPADGGEPARYGELDARSKRLVVFAAGLFAAGWAVVALVGG